MSTLTSSLKLALIIAADLVDALRSQVSKPAPGAVLLELNSGPLQEILRVTLSEHCTGDIDEADSRIGNYFLDFLTDETPAKFILQEEWAMLTIMLTSRVYTGLEKSGVKVNKITWGNDNSIPSTRPA